MARFRSASWYAGMVTILLVLVVVLGLLLLARPAPTLLTQGTAAVLFLAIAVLVYRHFHREAEQNQILLEVNQGLAARLELGDQLDHVVEAISRLVPRADKCVLHLLDEQGRRLYPRYSSKPESVHPLGMPADKGIAGQALKELQTIMIADVRREPDFLPLKSGEELRSLMVVPLYIQHRPLGTISLNSSVPAAFTQRDQTLVNVLAVHASIALNQEQLIAANRGERHYVETLINSLPDALVVLDAERCLRRHNTALAHVLGADLSRLIGQRVEVSSPDERVRRLAFVLGEPHDEIGQSHVRQVELNEPAHAVLRVSTSAVTDQEGRRAQIAIIQDITELMVETRSRASLLTAVSRELPPSLDLIRGYTTLVGSYDFPEQPPIKEWMGRIHEECSRLSSLARILGDLCLIHTNEMDREFEPVDLCDLLSEVTGQLTDAIRRRNVAIDVACSPDLPKVRLDLDRLRHVLQILLENAIHRARPDGHIDVRVAVSPDDVTFAFGDDGTPIPAEARRKALRDLYSVDGAVPSDPAGTGLFLHIGRRIIEAQGGYLWMPEDGDQHTRFQLILPIGRDAGVGIPGGSV